MNNSSQNPREGWETLVRAVLHDLNSRLAGVLGFGELLIKTLRLNKRLPKEVRGYVDSLNGALQTLVRSRITSVQTLLRPHSIEEFSFDTLLQEIVKQCGQSPNIQIRIDDFQRDVSLLTYRDVLREAMTIVIDNSIMAVRQSGIISISVATDVNHLLIKVRDTGNGFDGAILNKLGSSPVYSEWGGTGTGLYICKELVTKLLRGDIQFGNVPGNGAEIQMKIPRRLQIEEIESEAPPVREIEMLPIEINPLTSEAQRYFKRKFLPRVRALRSRIRKETLAICIWGPGVSEHPLYPIRLNLLSQLRNLGHAAFFSEYFNHDAGTSVSSQTMPSLIAEEFLHASAADLVIVIRASPGSLAEFHDFAQFRSIAQNMLVVADEKDTLSYSDKGALLEHERLYGKVIRYINISDITPKVLDVVAVLQCQKFLARQHGKDWKL